MIKTGKFRVWNKTRNTLLCDEITLADAGEEQLDQVIERIVMQPGAGLWLKPCIGAPIAEGAPPFDMVCIDQGHRVVEQYESFVTGTFVLFQPRTTSALIFPARAIASSQTQVGDVLDIKIPDARTADLVEAPVSVQSPMPPPAREAAGTEAESAVTAVTPEVTRLKGTIVPTEWSSHEEPAEEVRPAEVIPPRKKNSLGMRFMRWLMPDKRRAGRVPAQNLTVHRWSGDQMHTYAVEDVSSVGIYMVTDERPFPGTVFMVTLKKTTWGSEESGNSLPIQLKVARWGADGLGMEFITTDEIAAKGIENHLEGGASTIQLQRFLQNI